VNETERGQKQTEPHKISIVYNFIGAFYFEAATTQAETEQEQTKTA